MFRQKECCPKKCLMLGKNYLCLEKMNYAWTKLCLDK